MRSYTSRVRVRVVLHIDRFPRNNFSLPPTLPLTYIIYFTYAFFTSNHTRTVISNRMRAKVVPPSLVHRADEAIRMANDFHLVWGHTGDTDCRD